ncbi:CPBP family intramembrane glutamic endopeptidase [Priestia megaterium]|uniref:CPBP family intramembrane glutamic endopeptidase n=2 Tax=Priestia megaterium TaxID=1404 RepID=UPI000BF58839|nr:type II CAAX endopeptidase family protein [Priestia megaterium]PER63516.1 hypothetical protein CN492_28590 [Priestia megaterium]
MKGEFMFNSMKIRYFLLSGFVFFIILFLGYFFILGKPQEGDSLFDIIFSYGLLGVFPFIWFSFHFKKQKYKISSVLHIKGIHKQLPTILVLICLLIAFSLGAYWLTNYMLSFIFPDYVAEMLSEDVPMPSNNFQYILLGINICLVGPIAEEFIFRGLLLKRLAKKTNIIASAIITNLIFGLIHSDIIGASMFGFILTLLFLKTDNLLVPIISHILNNTILMVLSIYLPDSPEFTNIMTIADLHDKMAPNLTLLIVSTIMLVIYIKINTKVLARKNQVKGIRSADLN